MTRASRLMVLAREQLRASTRMTLAATGMVAVIALLMGYLGTFAIAQDLIFRNLQPVGFGAHAGVTSTGYDPLTSLTDAMDTAAGSDDVDGFFVAPTVGDSPAQFIHWIDNPDNLEPFIVDGTTPGVGDVVVSRQVAEQAGLAIGDTVEVTVNLYDQDDLLAATDGIAGVDPVGTVSTSMTVSGITIDETTTPLLVFTPGNFVASAATFALLDIPDGTAPILTAHYEWTGEKPATLQPLTMEDLYAIATPASVASVSNALNALPGGGIAALVLVVLVLVSIGASIQFGQSQAAHRQLWITTARTLGTPTARLGTVAAIEAVAIGLVGTLTGLTLGVVVAVAQISATGLSTALFAGSVWWGLVLMMVATPMLTAAIIATVPLLWARKVAPVEAIKPTGPAVVRRRLPAPTWLIAGTGVAALTGLIAYYAAYVANAVVNSTSERNVALLVAAGLGVVALGGIGTVIVRTAAATTTRVAAGMSASTRIGVLVAGDAITATRRAAATTAGTVALLATSLGALMGALGAENRGIAPGVLVTALAVLAPATAVLLWSWWSQRSAVALQWTTRAALGLPVAIARRAHALSFTVPAAVGVAVGLAASILLLVWGRIVTLVVAVTLADPASVTFAPQYGYLLDTAFGVAGGLGLAVLLLAAVFGVAYLIVSATSASSPRKRPGRTSAALEFADSDT